MSLVERIKKLCDEKKVSFAEVERSTGISNGQIRRWDKSSPKIDNVTKVANYFDVSTDYLLGRTSDENESIEIPFQTWFRKDNEDLTKDEQDEILEDLEDYLEYRKQRILKKRDK
ncbi:Cro/CI family transcriptional regulator [Gracilibacillus halophilus YIM-C55.5]|uniref:Cro/CI family transcriptional regulator n=1 Tax=Gracilibacillus halophilus YIM-C55.5 TaxID=1308866 RepID=N4W8R0_9BACI|nr:helix-turn-helix transcriptional regulator [Gracilibacillus halophilus]ENH96683.1 Cro/CI family transcriptional regulator [Gracilibacillus halophilus YIM-C55.5]